MIRGIQLTREELEAERAEILARHPELADYLPEDECPCCAVEDVRSEFGHDAADAWHRLDTIRFLLGEHVAFLIGGDE